MGDVVDIDKDKARYAVLVMCIACGNRWIGLVLAQTSLTGLECPKCHKQDSFASFLPQPFLDEYRGTPA